MNRQQREDGINEIFARIVKEHDEALRGLAESERIDRERFERGLDSEYGFPEDDTNEDD